MIKCVKLKLVKNTAYIILIASLILPLPLYANVYKYVDENGKVWLIGKGNDNNKLEKQKPKNEPKKEERKEEQKKDVRNEEKSVEIYVRAWCGYCRKLEKFLKENNIEYKRFDLDKDSEALDTFNRLGGKGVPLIRVGSKVIKGYNPDAILAAYNS